MSQAKRPVFDAEPGYPIIGWPASYSTQTILKVIEMRGWFLMRRGQA